MSPQSRARDGADTRSMRDEAWRLGVSPRLRVESTLTRMKVRLAKKTDIPAIDEILTVEGIDFGNDSGPSSAEALLYAADGPFSIALVSESDGRLHGFMVGGIFAKEYLEGDEPIEDPGTFSADYVLGDLAGQTALLSAIPGAAEARGWSRVVALVADPKLFQSQIEQTDKWQGGNIGEAVAWVATAKDGEPHLFFSHPEPGLTYALFADLDHDEPVWLFDIDGKTFGQGVIDGAIHFSGGHSDHRIDHLIAHLNDGVFDDDLPVGEGARGLAHRH